MSATLAELRHEEAITRQERDTLQVQMVSVSGQFAELQAEKKEVERELADTRRQLEANMRAPKELEV